MNKFVLKEIKDLPRLSWCAHIKGGINHLKFIMVHGLRTIIDAFSKELG